jgi:hypothetical protein
MVQLAPHALGIFSTIHGFMERGVEEGDGRAIDPVAEELPENTPSSGTGMMEAARRGGRHACAAENDGENDEGRSGGGSHELV